MEPLLEKIVAAGLVTGEQADTARAEAVKTNRSVWGALVKLEYLSEEQVVGFFAQEARIPYIRLSEYRIKKSAWEMLDEQFCRQHMVMPFCRIRDTVYIACTNPFDTDLLDMIAKISRCSVEPLMATATSIQQALDHYWRQESIDFAVARFLVKQEPVKGMPFWRESERIAVDWPVCVVIQDESFSLAGPTRCEGTAFDISRDGSAIGIYLSLYIPKGVGVKVIILAGYPSGRGEEMGTSGEIVHAFMRQARQFALGVRLNGADAGFKEKLVKYAARPS